MKNLPNCTCGANDWQGSGGQIGPYSQFFVKSCRQCRATLHFVHRDGWTLGLVQPPDDRESIADYINGTLLLQARSYHAEWKSAVEAKRQEQFDHLCRAWGMDPSKGVQYDSRDGNGVYVDTTNTPWPINHKAFR